MKCLSHIVIPYQTYWTLKRCFEKCIFKCLHWLTFVPKLTVVLINIINRYWRTTMDLYIYIYIYIIYIYIYIYTSSAENSWIYPKYTYKLKWIISYLCRFANCTGVTFHWRCSRSFKHWCHTCVYLQVTNLRIVLIWNTP